MKDRCPVCDAYSCRCSDYRLREYRDRHRFDHSSNVLQRWNQDDASARVEQELRDRRRKEREEEERQEEERLERRRQDRRREESAQEEQQQEQEPEEDAQ